MEVQEASVFTPHSASHLSSAPTPVWHTSPKWRENISSDTTPLSGQTSSVPKLFHETTWDPGSCQLWGQSMIWQHPIVLGLRIWSLQISECNADHKEMISCSPGFTLKDIFRCILAESSPSVGHCRCFLIKFLSASLLNDEEVGWRPMVSGNAKNKRTGLQENNKQSSLKILQESFSEDTVRFSKYSI